MSAKPKLSVYWGASCGGCEIAIANLHEKILLVDQYFDFMFCPCLLDTKRKDIEALPDGNIALTLFNGAIRTEENEEMARQDGCDMALDAWRIGRAGRQRLDRGHAP